jgi:hypothetical protein
VMPAHAGRFRRDLLAYLDRTGQKLTAAEAAAVMAAPSAQSTARTTRRVP